jgi:hypothetical protein
MIKPEPKYLGDGVYAKYDGRHIVLTAGRCEEDEVDADNIIFLAPEVMSEVIRYNEYVNKCLETR